MPQITLCLTIEIHNYPEIARNNSGLFAGLAARLPYLGNIVEEKIDSEIVKRVKDVLGDRIVDGLENGLLEKGVTARVAYEFSDLGSGKQVMLNAIQYDRHPL